MHAGETRQRLVLAENLFDHDVERRGVLAARVADQSAQALEILRRVAQAVDVVEPQALQLALGDQPLHQAVDRLEGAGILDAQAGQRIDVEEAAVVDVAGGEPPVPELVVLALQQQMQRLGLRWPVLAGAIGVEPSRDELGGAVRWLSAPP